MSTSSVVLGLGRIAAPCLLALTLISACNDGHGSPLLGFRPCGGDPSGQWTIVDFYVDDDEGISLGTAIDNEPMCAGALLASTPIAKGTYEFGPGSNYSRDATLAFDIDFRITSQCFTAISGAAQTTGLEIKVTADACEKLQTSLSASQVFTKVDCSFGADSCTCDATTREIPIDEFGMFTVSNDHITINNQDLEFCVSGNQLDIKRTDAEDGEALVRLQKK